MDAEFLAGAPFFSTLDDAERRALAPYATYSRVAEGKVLVQEGDFSYELLVVEEGEAEVTRGGEHVADIGPGDLIGEVGVLGKTTRGATVTAKTTMSLI